MELVGTQAPNHHAPAFPDSPSHCTAGLQFLRTWGELEEDFISDTDDFKVSSGLFILKVFLTCSIIVKLNPMCPLDGAQRCPDSDGM